MRRSRFAIAVLVFASGTAVARADTITFETGFVDLQAVTSAIVTPTNTVTFQVGPGAPTGDGFIAAVGLPQTAFFLNDLPAGGSPGQFFLTDEIGNLPAPILAHAYFIEFARPVADLQLDLYDLELDGNTATLTVYSDVARTNVVGSDAVTIVGSVPEGLVSPLAVLAPSAPIRAATLSATDPVDTGNGIDNVTFTTLSIEPVPTLPTPLFFGLALLLAATAALRAPD